MFDFLKKKIGGFIDGLTKKEAAASDAPSVPDVLEAPEEKPGVEEIAVPVMEKRPPEPVPKEEEPKETMQIPEPEKIPGPAAVPPKPAPQIIKAPPKKQKPAEAAPVPPKPEAKKEPIAPQTTPAVRKPAPKTEVAKPSAPARLAPQKSPEAPAQAEEKKRIKLSAVSAIKSFITSEVEIKEGDVREMLELFELELLEADVDMSVAEAIGSELRGKLVGARIPKNGLHGFVGDAIRGTLTDIITNDKAFDIVERVDGCEKPAKIMFLGINGAGKTTTIAKVARLLMDSHRKVVFAAADTFRAAAIEQLDVHAERLGVKVIKRDYGSDPTSVAYDAVNYARAHGIDAVLIDTAGRQDTNISLLNEMKKMTRVISPDLKIYIGESIAGNAIIEQISAFNREIGIDAVILTKMDCDPKGGTMLSINRATGIPIIYVGVGQAYSDLEKFDPAKIVGRIVE